MLLDAVKENNEVLWMGLGWRKKKQRKKIWVMKKGIMVIGRFIVFSDFLCINFTKDI